MTLALAAAVKNTKIAVEDRRIMQNLYLEAEKLKEIKTLVEDLGRSL